ncbi:hypothetical protein BBJ28_00011623 [Nothophytophthora sp. Chile5]|nr:hypothetical protein BBJ28_00011623 [Nothophytophthora sp. Chile5]
MSGTNGTFVPVDDAYPLAPQELQMLLQMHQKCRTPGSAAMRTWCTGGDEDSYLDEEEDDVVLCPRGVQTHPCTGRALRANRSVDEDDVEFFWPWEGIRCDAYTEPTTVTHMQVFVLAALNWIMGSG